MIEEEARKKRCGGPNGCGTLINPASGGRIPKEMLLQLAVEVNQPRWCIASDCMMWRTIPIPNGMSSFSLDEKGVRTENYDDGGYCGLAGKR